MKKLLLFSAFVISGLSIITNTQCDITVSHTIEHDNQYTINLTDNDKMIGSISYEQMQPLHWKIKEIFVTADQRKIGLGTNLITQCMQHIALFGFEKIELDVMPIDPTGPTLEDLIAFYIKIFKKLAPAPFYSLHLVSDEECPWLATIKMIITKNSEVLEETL